MSLAELNNDDKYLPIPANLASLRWHRIRTTLVNRRIVPSMSAHPVTVFEAIIKDVNRSLNWIGDHAPHPVVFFHAVDRRSNLRLWPGQMIPLETLLTGATTREAYRWLEAFDAYLLDPQTGKNFAVVYLEDPEVRSPQKLVDERGFSKTEGEICLEFMMPLAFKVSRPFGRTFLNKNDLVSLFTRRLSRLFDMDFSGIGERDDFQVVHEYWRYTEIMHSSVSQPGTMQYINGCIGPLIIQGSFPELLPYLLIGSELHAGTKLANSRGYYRLHENVPANFKEYFPSLKRKHEMAELVAA